MLELQRNVAVVEAPARQARAARLDLLASDDVLRSVLESAPDLVMIVDREGTVLFANRTIPGFTIKQVIGANLNEFAPKSKERRRRALACVFDTGRPDSYQSRVVLPGGKEAWFLSRLRPVKRNGDIIAAAVFVSEITARVQFEQQSALRSQEIATLYQIASLVAQPGDFRTKAGRILTHVARAAGARSATLLLAEKDGLRLVGIRPASVEANAPKLWSYDKSVTGEAFRKGATLVLNDYRSHPKALNHTHTGIASIALLPIKVQGSPAGVLSVSSRTPGHFTPDRVALLEAVAAGMGPLLDNARLQESERQRAQSLESLVRVAGILVKPGSFERKLAPVFRELIRISEARSAGLLVPDGDSLRMVQQVKNGRPTTIRVERLSFDRSLAGLAFSKDEAVIVNDYAAHPLASPVAVSDGIRSIVVLPVRAGGRVFGTLAVGSGDVGHFTPERATMVTAVCDGIGALLENARLYEQASADLKVSRRRLRAFQTAAERLALEEDPERVLQGIVDTARELVDARQGLLALWGPGGALKSQVSSGPPASEGGNVVEAKLLQKVRKDRKRTRVRTPGFLGVPVSLKDGTSGAFCVVGKDGGAAFTQDDERLLHLFAVLARVFVENISLFNRVTQERSTLEAVQASMAEGLGVIDPSGRVMYFNRAAEQATGIKAADVLGQPYRRIVELLGGARVSSKEAAEAVRAVLSGASDSAATMEITVLGNRELSLTAFPIPLAHGGRMVGILCRDVTEQRNVQRRREAFVTIASHELRTPTTAVMGYAELLLTRNPPEATRRQWLERIHTGGKRLTTLLDDLLDASIIQSGRMRVSLAPVSIADTAREVVRTLRSTTDRHQLIVDAPGGLSDVSADQEKLYQILENLVGNAIRYSPSGGPVTISASEDPERGRVIVTVADQGVGISAEDQKRLFTTFQRIPRRETERVGGAGLGLYVVRGLVEVMGGQIWVESAVNKGSTFFVSLLAAPNAAIPLEAVRSLHHNDTTTLRRRGQ